jgi:hypothetical protein
VNELPILIALEAAPGIAIQGGTQREDNDAVRDPIVAALAQLVRDAYANEQRMGARLYLVQSSGDEPEADQRPDGSAPEVPSAATEQVRRKSA